MISKIDGDQIRIRRDNDGGYSLTCSSLQVAALKQMWAANDFPLFEVHDDGVTVGGASDTQVTILFGGGDPINQYQQTLDAVQDDGLLDGI